MNEKNRDIDAILEECLELMAQGKTVADCLAAYPSQSAELKSLLETALTVKKAMSIEPNPAFKARARYQFRTVMAKAAEKKRRPLFGWRPRWAVAVASLMLALVVSSGGVAVASTNSMPDDFLYPVKLATEQVMLNLTFSAEGKARRYMEMADERVAEIVYLAGKGDIKGMENANRRLGGYLSTIAGLTASGDLLSSDSDDFYNGVLDTTETNNVGQKHQYQYNVSNEMAELILGSSGNNSALLEEAMETASSAVKAQLRKALDTINEGYQNALGTAGS